MPQPVNRVRSIFGAVCVGAGATLVGCAAPPSAGPAADSRPVKAPAAPAQPATRSDAQAARAEARAQAASDAAARRTAQAQGALSTFLSRFFMSPSLEEPAVIAPRTYTRSALAGFASRVVAGATAVDFDPSLSVVASCSQQSPAAQVMVEGNALALDPPPTEPAKLPCLSVTLSPNMGFVAVTYGWQNRSIAKSTAIFALSRKDGQPKATLVQFAPGASSIDFSRDSSKALLASQQLNSDLGRPGNYIRLVDLREGKEIFHRPARSPAVRGTNQSAEVHAARFTATDQRAVVLLAQGLGSRFWFDLDLETGQLSGARPMSELENYPTHAISPDRDVVASVINQERFNVYQLRDGTKLSAMGANPLPRVPGRSEARSVAFSSSGRLVATCSDTEDSARIVIWSHATSKRTGEREYKGARCSSMEDRAFRFAPDDRDILIAQRAGGLQWVPSPGVIDPDFDRVARVVDSGDMAAIKREFDNAKGADAKKLVETLLVKKYLAKVLTIRTATRGLDGKAFGGAGDGAMAQLATMIAGYKVGTESTVEVDYTLQLDPKIFKISHTYAFMAEVVLTATGEGHYDSNCLWPLPKVCRNPMNTQKFSSRVSGELVRNQATTGRTTIKWYPKFASESIGGLTKSFVADSIKVSVDQIRIDLSE